MADIVQENSPPGTVALVKGIISDAEELLAAQVALFRKEMKEDVNKAKEAMAALLVGGVFAVNGVICLSVMLALLLSWIWPELPLWGSFAIVGGIVSAAGACLLVITRQRLASLKPEKSLQAVEENVRWMAHK